MTARTWLVTGCSRGLGHAYATAIVASGDCLVATARDASTLDDLVAAAPDRVRAMALDVVSASQTAAAVDAAVRAFGRVDVIVANAAIADYAPFEEMPVEHFELHLATNLGGPVNLTRAVLPVMRAQGGGHLVYISTVAGRRAVGAGLVAYATSKHALEGFAESVAAEVAGFGIVTTIIELGGFRTDMISTSAQRIAPPGPDYEALMAPVIDRYNRVGEPAKGDPAKAAQALLRIVAMEQPPLRVALGSDAYGLIQAAEEAKIADRERWAELSPITDADDATPFDLEAWKRIALGAS